MKQILIDWVRKFGWEEMPKEGTREIYSFKIASDLAGQEIKGVDAARIWLRRHYLKKDEHKGGKTWTVTWQ